MKNLFLFFLGLTLTCSDIVAGEKDFKLKQYGIEEDFGGIFIYSIVQDNDGYLWVSTDDGLYRYDGIKMLNLSKKDSSFSRLITASEATSDDGLYIGDNTGGISRIKNGLFETIMHPDSMPSKINAIQQKNNTIWILSQNNGIATIDQGIWKKYRDEKLDKLVAYDMIVHDNFLYVATNEGLLRFEKSGSRLTKAYFIDDFNYLAISTLFQDPIHDQLLWVGSEEGLLLYNLENGRITKIKETQGLNIKTIVRDKLNELWIGTAHSGLIEVKLKNNKPIKFTHYSISRGFVSNEINSLYVDRENEIWVGTFGNGLLQLNRTYFHHYELRKSIGIEGINDIYQVNDDFFYLATDKGLIEAFNKPGKDSLNFREVGLFSLFKIKCILKQADILWLGTANNGLIRYDIKNKQVKKIELNPVDPGTNHLVRYLAEGQDGSLWVSIAGNGVYNLTLDGKLIKHYNTRNGFYHNEIFAIFPDRAGNIWFGAHTVGLAILKPEGQIQYLTKDELFPGRDINSISQDYNGKIWVATGGEGLYGYDGEAFERFDQTNGLISNYCNAVEIDKAGQIWVGHRMGLSLIQPEYKLVRKFDHPSELGETEAVINSVEKDKDGNIWFGNPYGITKVIRPHDEHRLKDREILIQRVRLFFEEIDRSKYSNNKASKTPFEFEHYQNHITFDFVAINLRNPKGIYYQYKLEGLDNEWSPVTNSNSATFTNLDPGNYTFLVRESDHPQLWPHSVHSVGFRIDFPYWEKWWFYLIQIGLIFGIMFLTIMLSKRIHNHFLIRLMTYVSLFLFFEYIHTELEPYIESIAGEVPIFQVGINLMLALILLPIEIKLSAYLKNEEARILENTKNDH